VILVAQILGILVRNIFEGLVAVSGDSIAVELF
jgi:hypothetical protein